MAKELDAQVTDFRHRPLDTGPYTFVAADALVLKVREGGRVVNVPALTVPRGRVAVRVAVVMQEAGRASRPTRL